MSGRDSVRAFIFYRACSPLIIDNGRPRYNRWWGHNLGATYWWFFVLRHGRRPTYWYWQRGKEAPVERWP